MRHVVICGLWHFFEKKNVIEHKMCILIFSTTFVVTFLSLTFGAGIIFLILAHPVYKM